MKSPWLPLGMGVGEQKESKQTEELRNRAAIKVCQNYVAKIRNHEKELEPATDLPNLT